MASLTYIRGSVLFAGAGDWGSKTQTYRVLLATDEYKPDRKHRVVSQVTGELAGSGYVRKDLTGREVLAKDTSGDCIADAVTFSGLRSVQTYRWAIIFRAGKTDSDSDLICAIDMDAVSLRAVTDHTIKWDGQAKSGRVFSIQ